MSNPRLLRILSLILLALLALAACEVYRHGAHAGLGIGLYIVPIVFVLSLMAGIGFGLRKPPPDPCPPLSRRPSRWVFAALARAVRSTGLSNRPEAIMTRIACTIILALLTPAFLPPADPGFPEEEPNGRTRPIDPKDFAGKWTRAASLEEQLGYNPDFPGEVEIQIDERLGRRWDRQQKTAFEAQATRMGHTLVASGQFTMSRLNNIPNDFAWEASVTRDEGSTYINPVLPQIGAVPFRIMIVRGKTSDRDLLFLEFQPKTEPEARFVSAYKRNADTEKAAPE